MNMVTTVAGTVGIAAAVILLGHVLEWFLGVRRDRRLYLNVVAMAAAVMGSVGYIQQTVLPEFPPSDGMLWIYWLAPVVAAVAIVNAKVGKPVVVWSVRVLTAGGGMYLVARPLLDGVWAEGGMTRVVVAIGATLIVWVGLQRLMERDEDDPSVPLGLGFAAAGAAVAISFVSSITIGLNAAVLAMGVGATALLLFVRSGTSARAAVDFTVPMLGVVYMTAFGYTDFAAIPILLLGAAPLLLWVGVFVADRSVWVRAAVRIVAVLVPVAIATPLAEQAVSEPEGEEQEVDEDGSYRPYAT